MPLHPVQEISKEQLQAIKDAVRYKLLELALASQPGSKPSHWILSELMISDGSPTNATSPLYDHLTWLNAATSGYVQMMLDAASLTADDLSSLLASGEKVNDGEFIGIYGFFDNSPETGELTGGAGQPPQMGGLVSLDFLKGTNRLDFWDCQDCYGYEDVVGIADHPIIYEENSSVVIKACFTEATEDKSVGLRAYVCERAGTHFRPDRQHLLDANGMFRNPADAIKSGVNPRSELTLAQIQSLKQRTIATIYQMAIDTGLVKNVADAMRLGYVRETVAGDESDLTDFNDLDQSATPQATGQQNWAQDATLFTAGDLANALVANEKVPKQRFIGIYGYFDRSTNPSMHVMNFEDGSGPLAFYQVEHCYTYKGVTQAYFEQPHYFSENSAILWKFAIKRATDYFAGLRAYTWELARDRVAEA